MNTFLLSQILAGIAFVAGMASFQFPNRRQVLSCWVISAAFNSAHFFVLNQTTAAIIVLVTAIRFLAAIFTTDRRALVFFLIVGVSSGTLTATQPLNYLGVVSMAIGTYGAFQSDHRRVRAVMLVCAIIWATHNFLVGSPVAGIMEVAFAGSNLIGLSRLRDALNQGSKNG